MEQLKRLGLSGNWLFEVPSSIGQLKKLEGLWIQGNLLKSIPKEVIVL
jgi:Leucine-rich repeat (LRR) protein